MKKIILLLFLLYCTWIHAQLENVTINHLPAISQLPVSAINCIFQDSEGYMWYGTVDGLCRDDGYNVHVFRSDFHTPKLMDINSVLCICEDINKNIWFGTQKGVYILNKKTYSIHKINIPELQIVPIGKMLIRKNGDIWIASQSSLYELDHTGNLRKCHKLSAPCQVLFEDRQQKLFYSTQDGGFWYKTINRKAIKISNNMPVRDMSEDYQKTGYWLLTNVFSVWHYTPKGKSAQEQFTLKNVKQANGSSDFREIIQDKHRHYLWILGNDNLLVFKISSNNQLEQISTQNILTPEKKILAHIYQSKDGNIWVSAFDHFSFVIRFKESDVQNYSFLPLLQATGFKPAIVTLCRDDDGAFWYYQEACGLFLYDPSKNGKPIHYQNCKAVSKLPLYSIPYLVKSRQHNSIWAMTPGTIIMKLRREGQQIFLQKQLDLASVSKTSGVAEVIYEDNNQNLWIGTMNGVFKYNHANNRLICISEKIGDVSDFTQAADGYIWCTIRNRGICRISPNTNKWKIFPYKIDFLTLDVTTDGTLWTSTGEGQILSFSSSNPTEYKDYTLQAGLNGDMVDHVKIDRFNHVWIVTPQTIREFNPKNGAVRVYSTQDNDILQHRFLPRAVFRDLQNGDMYFGGIPGIVSFKTSLQLESIPQNITPCITDIKIMGKSIWLDPIRTKTSNSIDIKPNEQNITIEFSTLDFQNSGRICYAYRLRGIDKDWVYLPVGKNSAIYNNVKKGNYIFEVKATDENGLWSNHITTFKIHRLPAWWETWWAYSVYGIFVLIIIWQIIKRYKQQVEKNNDIIIQENIQAGKKDYFTNISQGLITPLMTISTIADNIQSSDISTQKKMGIIQENVNRLKGMMQQEMETQLHITKIDEHFIEKATKIVEQHLGNEKLDVVFLASELGMSRSTFSRKLKAVIHQTPLEFIRGIKMKHAAEMLKQKTASIQDVMQAIGYNDHKTFTQVFRDTFGMTPSEYQRDSK